VPRADQYSELGSAKVFSGAKSISSGAQYVGMWPSENIFHIQLFSCLFFCNPTHKTESGRANRWGTTNSKPPGPIIRMSQSKTLTGSQIIFITLFSAHAHRCCATYQPPQTVKLCCAKTIFLRQTGTFDFFIQWCCAGLHTEHRWKCSKGMLSSSPLSVLAHLLSFSPIPTNEPEKIYSTK